MQARLLQSQPCVTAQKRRTVGHQLGQHPLLQGEGIKIHSELRDGEESAHLL